MPLDKDNRRLYYDDTYGISLIDVARCLGDKRKDKDGNYNLSLLCTSPYINPWAKYKPVRRPFLVEEDRQADWWRAEDGMCGLDFTDAAINTDLSNIAAVYNNTGWENGWKHAAPRGGDTEPFRLADFVGNVKNIGYNHKVAPFVSGFEMAKIWAQDDTDNFEVAFRITETNDTDVEYISYKDLALENYYLGMAFVQDGAVVLTVINSNVISTPDSVGQSGFRMEIDPESVPVGEYTVYPFIANGNGTTVAITKAYTVPNVMAEVFKMEDAMLTVIIDGTLTLNRWDYRVTVTNNSQKVAELQDFELRLRSGQTSSFNDPMSDGYVSVTADGTITIDSGVTVTVLDGHKQVPQSLLDSSPTQRLYFYHVGQKGKEYNQRLNQQIQPNPAME